MGYTCGSAADFVDATNAKKPSMAIRLSTGWMTNFEDAMAPVALFRSVLLDWDTKISHVQDVHGDDRVVSINQDWADRIGAVHGVSKVGFVDYAHIGDLVLGKQPNAAMHTLTDKSKSTVFVCCPLKHCNKADACLLMARACGWTHVKCMRVSPKSFPVVHVVE